MESLIDGLLKHRAKEKKYSKRAQIAGALTSLGRALKQATTGEGLSSGDDEYDALNAAFAEFKKAVSELRRLVVGLIETLAEFGRKCTAISSPALPFFDIDTKASLSSPDIFDPFLSTSPSQESALHSPPSFPDRDFAGDNPTTNVTNAALGALNTGVSLSPLNDATTRGENIDFPSFEKVRAFARFTANLEKASTYNMALIFDFPLVGRVVSVDELLSQVLCFCMQACFYMRQCTRLSLPKPD